MSDIASAKSPGPESPAAKRQATESPIDTPPPPAARRRLKLKAMWAPLLMTAAAVVLGLTAWRLYPKTTQHPAPSFASLVVTASTPISDVFYNVTRVSSAISKVNVEVDAVAKPHAGKLTAGVDMLLPLGTVFQDCPHPACMMTPKERRPGSRTTSPSNTSAA
jgi:hypothetical protein